MVRSFFIFPLAAIVLPFFVSFWWAVACIIAIPLNFIISRKAMARAVFKELLGKGKQPYETREKIYSLIVERGGLYAFRWENPSDPLGLFSDNSIENTIKNLMTQQINAAAQGQRVVNRLPESARIIMLKVEILRSLGAISDTLSDDGVSEDVWECVWEILDRVDLGAPMGEIGESFDEIQVEIPRHILMQLEAECKNRNIRHFGDLPLIIR